MKKMEEKRSSLCLAAVSLLFMLAMVTLAGAKTQISTVEVEGVGFSIAGDRAEARDSAINDARLRAVEQALGVEVDAATVIRQSLLVDDTLLTTSHGMVRNYTILQEGEDGHGLYRVRIRAEVDRDVLDSTLKKAAGRRRIVLLTPADNSPEKNGQAVQRAIRAFVEAGFTLLPQGLQVDRFSLLDRQKIKKIAAKHRADLVLGVSLRADTPQCPVSNYCATKGEGLMVLWSGKNGDELARAEVEQDQGRGFGNTAELAIRDSLRRTGGSLATSMVEQLFHPPEIDLKLIVRHLPDVTAYQQLIARLRAMRWVRQVKPDGLGFHRGKSVLLVRFAGRADLFGSMLDIMPDFDYQGRVGHVLRLVVSD